MAGADAAHAVPTLRPGFFRWQAETIVPRTAGRRPSPEATGQLRHGLPDRGARAGFPTALETVPSRSVTSPRSTPGIRRVPRSDSATPTAADAARQVAFPPPDSPGVTLPRSRSSRKRRSRPTALSTTAARSTTTRPGTVPVGHREPSTDPHIREELRPGCGSPHPRLRRFGGGSAAATPAPRRAGSRGDRSTRPLPRRAPRRVPHLAVGGSAPAMAADTLTRIAPPHRNSRPPHLHRGPGVPYPRPATRSPGHRSARCSPAPRPRTNDLRCSSSA